MDANPPIFLESAARHGVTEEDALHAWAFAIDAYTLRGGMVVYVVPDRAGNLLEVGVVECTRSLPSSTPCRPETSS